MLGYLGTQLHRHCEVPNAKHSNNFTLRDEGRKAVSYCHQTQHPNSLPHFNDYTFLITQAKYTSAYGKFESQFLPLFIGITESLQ